MWFWCGRPDQGAQGGRQGRARQRQTETTRIHHRNATTTNQIATTRNTPANQSFVTPRTRWNTCSLGVAGLLDRAQLFKWPCPVDVARWFVAGALVAVDPYVSWPETKSLRTSGTVLSRLLLAKPISHAAIEFRTIIALLREESSCVQSAHAADWRAHSDLLTKMRNPRKTLIIMACRLHLEEVAPHGGCLEILERKTRHLGVHTSASTNATGDQAAVAAKTGGL